MYLIILYSPIHSTWSSWSLASFELCLQNIKDCAPYQGWNIQLQEKGIFESKLLDALQNVEFVEGLFTFLELIAHLCIIIPLNNLTETTHTSLTQNFIPAVLPSSHITDKEKERFKKTCQPMVLQFENKVVPQVSYIINVSHNSTIIVVIGCVPCYCSSFTK